eukprot:3231400-Pyramimonas_sp.AAC.1
MCPLTSGPGRNGEWCGSTGLRRTSNSSILIARCPDGVFTRSVTVAPLPSRSLCESVPGMTIFSLSSRRSRWHA